MAFSTDFSTLSISSLTVGERGGVAATLTGALYLFSKLPLVLVAILLTTALDCLYSVSSF
jgi:hypothetical protein